jgi:hypothetical protein
MTPATLFCPKCGHSNERSDSNCTQCGAALPKRAASDPTPLTPAYPAAPALVAEQTGRENKFKLSTGILIVVGVILPLWPITLPLCWVLAYFSYKKAWPI